MTTPAPEAIQADAVAAARAALEQRLSWASLDWPNLYPNMIDAIIGTVVPAAAPIIAAQAKAEAWDAVIARIDLGTPHMVDEKYVAGAVWVRNQITDVLKAATIERESFIAAAMGDPEGRRLADAAVALANAERKDS